MARCTSDDGEALSLLMLAAMRVCFGRCGERFMINVSCVT